MAVAHMRRNMNSTSWTIATDSDRDRTRHEVLTDYRARLALEEEARAYRRQLDLAEQYSDVNPPAMRVAMWEKLHGLHMPADPKHPILDAIAISTRLTLLDVQAVQAARKLRVSGAA